jgi:phosphatidylserine/phosphatidylglycerophosphate/cardiolipin synthase-like enzyme
MNPAEFAAILKQSLADHKLSGGEKTALAAWVAANVTTDQHRGVARHELFAVAKAAAETGDPRTVIDWLEDVLKVLLPVMPVAVGGSAAKAEAFFSPGDACRLHIAHRFSSARQSADVCVFTITDDRITRAILDAHRRGVTIRIITDNEKAFDPGSDVERLRSAGVPLKVDATPFHMHHKFAIFDKERLLNGSYNWTLGAAEQNEENIVDTGDGVLVAAFSEAFETLWEKLR